jgi:hypothetical protein
MMGGRSAVEFFTRLPECPTQWMTIGVGIVISHDPLHRPGRALVSASGSYLG